MRRMIAVLALLVLVAASCGGDDDSAAPEEAGVEAPAPPDAAPPPEAAPPPSGDSAAPAGGMLDELNVAFFLEWPTANQVAQAEQTYDAELGLTVNWIPFASGGDMAQAMESGDIDISYSQGLTPFANFVTGGSDLLLVGVAVTYADADNCVAHPDYGVTAANARADAGGSEHLYAVGQCDALQAVEDARASRCGHLHGGSDPVRGRPGGCGGLGLRRGGHGLRVRRGGQQDDRQWRQPGDDRRRAGGHRHPGVRHHLHHRRLRGDPSRHRDRLPAGHRGRQPGLQR